MSIEPADERILRAKYLDWCSARVADRFLALTPDQIYDLAHVSGSGLSVGSEDGAHGAVSYRELVARVTEVLAARLGLPSYEAWLAEYERSPEQFEAELLGLWKKQA